ncbi:MAG: MMPL family transporter [Solirubrobacterales bacterium]|nr:MMPL family transporter [Solirubrobacterales bacterium]
MFATLSRSVIAHPWRTIAVWLVAAGLVIALSPSLSTYTTSNQQAFLPGSFESVKAQNVGNKYFPAQSGATGSIVVSRNDGGKLTSGDQQKVQGLVSSLSNDKIPGVTAVKLSSNSLAPNGKVMAPSVVFAGQPGDSKVNSAVDTVRSKTSSYLAGSGLKNGLTGNAAISVDTTNAYDHANTIITIATIVLIVGLLGIIFRSPLISLLPILVIGIVHSAAVGITADLASLFGFQVSNSVAPILVVVLFGVGTDYIVFLLFRYRERLRHGASHHDALRFASSKVGVVIASSALTVIGAFAALLLAKLGSLQTLAPALIVAVASMLLTGLTLVPALFILLGSRLFWPLGPGQPAQNSVFAKEGRFVARHPGLLAGCLAIVLGGLTAAASGYSPTYNTLSELPASTASQVAYNTLASAFPAGSLSPTQVYTTSSKPLAQSDLQTLSTNLSKAKGVAQVAPPTLSSDNKAALTTVILKDDPYSNQALDNVKGPVRNAAHSSAPADQVLVGGQTSTFVDIRAQLRADTKLVFPVAVGIILVILAILLQALVAPLNLLVGVALAFGATLGASVIVFLDLLGFDGIDFSLPMTLYLFVVAIGTDYNILMASRLREEFMNGYSATDATRIAITNDAPTVAAAGIILALTFGSLMLAGLDNLTELGFGVLTGILIAGFVMAPVMIPALSTLEGRLFWWPRHARPPAVPRTSEPEPEPATAAQTA